MELRFTAELCYPLEAATLLARFAYSPSEHDERPAPLPVYKERFAAARHVPMSTLDELLAPLQKIFDHVEAHLDLPRETLVDYFGMPHFPSCSYGTCIAYLNLMSRPLAELAPQARFNMLKKAIFDLFLNHWLADDSTALPCQNEAELFDQIAAAQIPDAAKLYLLRFYHHAAELQPAITAILGRTEQLLRERESVYLPWVSEFLAREKRRIDAEGIGCLREQYHINIPPDGPELVITPSLTQFEMVGLTELETESGSRLPLCYRIGILVDELRKLAETGPGDSEVLAKRIKALDDKSRLNILQELRRRPLCGQELVDHTGLTASTISHHMGALLQANLVDLSKDGPRIRYALSPPGVRALLRELEGFLLGQGDSP